MHIARAWVFDTALALAELHANGHVVYSVFDRSWYEWELCRGWRRWKWRYFLSRLVMFVCPDDEPYTVSRRVWLLVNSSLHLNASTMPASVYTGRRSSRNVSYRSVLRTVRSVSSREYIIMLERMKRCCCKLDTHNTSGRRRSGVERPPCPCILLRLR